MECYAVIMAGGVGSRFWPRSRKASPKQLLNIVGENTMIQDTVYRLEGLIPQENVIIITNKIQKAIIEEQLPDLPADQIIAEPVGRNTAPCVGLSAILAKAKQKDAVLVTLPADHLIEPKETFINALEKAIHYAYESKGLVTFGIQPTRPETGYGYIKYESTEVSSAIHKVEKFVEKPDLETAQTYLDSGDYLWNSGMFIWRTDVILDQFKQNLPTMIEQLDELTDHVGTNAFDEKLKDIYPKLQSISIDYGIMEKAENVYLVKAAFNWSDVGSWQTVYELSKKDKNQNSVTGNVFLKDTNGSYIYAPDTFTAVIGQKDIVVINTKDALLISHRDRVQEVKDVVEHLKEHGKDDLL